MMRKSFSLAFIENANKALSKRLRETPVIPVCSSVDILSSFGHKTGSQEPEDCTDEESALTLSHLRVMNQYMAHLDHMVSDPQVMQSGTGFVPCAGFWPNGLSAAMKPPTHRSDLPPSELLKGVVKATCLDRDAVREFLSSVPGDWREYDVDVCDLALRGRADLLAMGSLESCVGEYGKWRSCGMLYPLAVAARYRRDPSLWLSENQLESELGKAFASFLGSAAQADAVSSGNMVREAEKLADVWHHTEDASIEAKNRLIGLFDMACMKMGVKSNGLQGGEGNGLELHAALAAFKASRVEAKTAIRRPKTKGLVDAEVHENVQAAWPRLNRRIQSAFPPSLLYSGLSSANKPTWGFDRLTLRVTNTPSSPSFHPHMAIHFAEGEMVCVLPTDPQFQVTLYRRCRLHDVLWRLGAIALSPEVGRLVVGAEKSSKLDECEKVMHHMDTEEGSPTGSDSEYSRTVSAMEMADESKEATSTDGLNEVSPATYVTWRIDLPSVMLRTHGEAPGLDAMGEWTSTEHLRKTTIKRGCKRSSVAATYLAQDGHVDEPGIRGLILEHFSKELARQQTDWEAEGGGKLDARNTTMAEAALCFTLAPPESKRSTIALGGRNKWESGGIDKRYAEVQSADNGFRFRDWAAVYCDAKSGCTWQCRLASHVVHTKGMFHTSLLWMDDAGKLSRVGVRSTLPFEKRVLKGKGLSSAIEGCFKHEPGLLPVHKLSSRVSRKDLEFYHPDDTRSIIVYSSPQNANTLEMAIFQTLK